jgi:small conductance mechanosensitive channel
MLALNLVPLFTFGEVLRRLAAILRIDGEELARSGLRVLGIWLLAWLCYRVVRLAARRIEIAVDDGDDSVTTLRERRGQTISQLLRSVGRVVVFAVALLLTFNVFIDIGPILAGAGILGLAVSFGAQSLVKDVISGFFILFENQFAIGDVIEVAGKSGVVEKMTLRVAVLRDGEGIMHVVPNSEIKVVSNKTRGWSRAVVDVGVPYDESVDRALEVLRDEAAQFSTDKAWGAQLDGPVEVLGVESLSDSAVVLRTVIRTQPGSQWSVAREFRRRVKNRFDRESLEIPFPQRRVHVRVEGGPAGADPIAAAAAAGAAGG